MSGRRVSPRNEGGGCPRAAAQPTHEQTLRARGRAAALGDSAVDLVLDSSKLGLLHVAISTRPTTAVQEI